MEDKGNFVHGSFGSLLRLPRGYHLVDIYIYIYIYIYILIGGTWLELVSQVSVKALDKDTYVHVLFVASKNYFRPLNE